MVLTVDMQLEECLQVGARVHGQRRLPYPRPPAGHPPSSAHCCPSRLPHAAACLPYPTACPLLPAPQPKYRGLQVVRRWFVKGITGEPAYPGDVPQRVRR